MMPGEGCNEFNKDDAADYVDDVVLVAEYMAYSYCGLFTPCKNCNFETRFRDYATVDEVVFSPRLASSRLLLSGNSKRLDRATVRRGHVTSSGSAVTSQYRVTINDSFVFKYIAF
jgi:hypothetical protein